MEAIRVALRCRPLVPKEEQDGCSECLQFVGDNQVVLAHNKAFTYDYVFGPHTPQADIYEMTITRLVASFFKGFNATVLAYGQTGSGKTHTMGSGYNFTNEDEMGVIPRVVRCIFESIEQNKEHCFDTRVSFLEIYKEDLMDLLVPMHQRDKDTVSIREANNGGILLQGLTERTVRSSEEMLSCLEEGSQGRTVGATAMNNTSSRSHAIFTIHMQRTSLTDSQDTFSAKFHLVDLAGSERAKKTGAEGTRFKEGVNINKGLLALGNVISALGDESQKRSHIPYRDSKLTRLLQDSLGGNSQTLMVACVSPADSNMEETLSTLRYADRARKIKNKPIVNRDPQTAEILRLKQQVQDLQVLLAQCSGSQNLPLPSSVSSANHEEVAKLKEKIKKLECQEDKLLERLHSAVNENATTLERAIAMEMAYENLKQKLDKIKEKTGLSMSRLDTTYVKDTATNTSTETAESAENVAEQNYKLLEEIHTEISQIGNADDDADLLSTIREVTEVSSQNASTEEESIDTEDDDDDDGDDDDDDCPGTPEQTAVNKSDLLSSAEKTSRKTATLSRNLAKLNSVLAEKQELCSKMKQGSEELRVKYEADIKTLEENLAKLQQEKDDLNSALVSAKSNAAASKLSEQRRKRIQELEVQMNELKRRMKEQAKSLKLKEQQDQQVTKLNSEIMALKQQRVKMFKQLKEENANFQKWKQAKDKEVLQLKAKERKHKAEIAKMERMNQKQHTVLQRKAEEAAAANRRLKEALGRQKLAAEDRKKRIDTVAASNTASRLKKYLADELEVMASVTEAKRHKQALIEDRKSLNKQLKDLKVKLEELCPPPAKKQLLCDSSTHSKQEEEAERIQEDINRIQQSIQMQTAQINDLQQKIIDADLDDRGKSRFTSVHSVVEAKCGLRFLLEKAAEAMSSTAQIQAQLTEAEDEVKERKNQLKELRKQQKTQQTPVVAMETKTESENTPVTADVTMLKDELTAKSQEVESLKKELTIAYYKRGRDGPLLPDISDAVQPPVQEPEAPSTRFFSPLFVGQNAVPLDKDDEKKELLFNETETEEEEDDYEEVDDSIEDDQNVHEDDENTDPNWAQGLTPAFSKNRPRINKPFKVEKPAACGCGGTCGTARCSCRKAGRKCSEYCKCKSDLCCNIEVQVPESTTDDSLQASQVSLSSTAMNATFVKDDSGQSPEVSSALFPGSRKRSSGVKDQDLPTESLGFKKKRKMTK